MKSKGVYFQSSNCMVDGHNEFKIHGALIIYSSEPTVNGVENKKGVVTTINLLIIGVVYFNIVLLVGYYLEYNN